MPSSDDSHRAPRWHRWLAFSLLVLILVGGGFRRAFGQDPAAQPAARPDGPPANSPPATVPADDYLQDPYDENLKNDRSDVQGILRVGQFAPGQQVLFDRYYQQHALARWTLPENRGRLTDYRRDLQNHLRSAKTSPVHNHLNTLALEFFRKLAAGRYHPPTRVGAMLMIGELNEVEAPSPSKLPVALPQARDVLLQTVSDPQQIEAVQVAALVGLSRHAQIGIPDTNAGKAVTDAMLALIKSKRPAERSVDVHAWMLAQAAEILGELGAVGEGGAGGTALNDMVADSKLSWSGEPRVAAAEALGRLNYQNAAALNASASAFATALGQLVADACAVEAESQNPSPRRLKNRVGAALVGLTGPSLDGTAGVASFATGPPHQALVAELKKSLEAILGVIDANEKDGKAMKEQLAPEAAKLSRLLTSGPAKNASRNRTEPFRERV
ncbi:MAG: hypothetical protein A2V70_03800 [Planctomycetes bacterium RBG_13_63_9]|nr:MAG: hypothetical protein A2V70_03800 [Planctomycetes bacterium RBG_13_63_9]